MSKKGPVPLAQVLQMAKEKSRAPAAPQPQPQETPEGEAAPAVADIEEAPKLPRTKRVYNLTEEEKTARRERLAKARVTAAERKKKRQEILKGVSDRMGPLAVGDRVELEALQAENAAGLLTKKRKERLARLLEHHGQTLQAAPVAAARTPLVAPQAGPDNSAEVGALSKKVAETEQQMRRLMEMLKTATEHGKKYQEDQQKKLAAAAAAAQRAPAPQAPKTAEKPKPEPEKPKMLPFELYAGRRSEGF